MNESQKDKPTAVVPRPTVGTDGFSLLPRTFEELRTFVHLVSQSEMVPKAYQGKPENVMVAIQMGMDIGLKPLQALQSIAVINGMPALWGDGALAICYASGALEDIEERSPEEALKQGGGWCKVSRKGMKTIERTFTVDQAKAAGLWGKAGPWQNYPGRMLQMRTRGLALRDRFADVLRGLYIAEEAQDIIVTASQPTITEAEIMPKSKSEMKSQEEAAQTPPPAPAPETDNGVKISENSPKTNDDSIANEDQIHELLDSMKVKNIKSDVITKEIAKRFHKTMLMSLTSSECEELTEWVRKI